MPAKSSEQSTPASLEIKAGLVTLPILKLPTSDIRFVANQLHDRIRQAPEFFRNAPVVIDLGEIATHDDEVDFPALMELLRCFDLIPVGIRGGNPVQQNAAQAAKLAILAEHTKTATANLTSGAEIKATSRSKADNAAVIKTLSSSSKRIEKPIRSGQRVYAVEGDLIVLSSVSGGAEILADGNIHIYGTLRGRALAGVQGNLDARIFCSDLQAELISIAGHYKISENLEETLQGVPVQIYLRDNSLIVQPL
jgi:septum site-determining protein MinC